MTMNLDEASSLQTEKTVPCASDLHEAILANSSQVVKLCLELGADPNLSPLLAPIGAINATEQEQARNLQRTLKRVFRGRQSGTINPLTVAVCNAYHHSTSGKREALNVVRLLLNFRADTQATCNGIVLCGVGEHASVTMASEKTASRVALFLKRFPVKNNEESCCRMMDSVATIILEHELGQQRSKQQSPSTQISRVPHRVMRLWKGLLNNDRYSDLVFVCPDGRVNAHKCVLVAATPYFCSALHGPWRENSSSSSDEWETSNSVHVMKAVLQFIYTGALDQKDEFMSNFDCMSSLLSVASEYHLDALFYLCEERLIYLLDSPLSCKTALCLATLHHLSSLKAACWDYIEENSAAVLLDSNFVTLSQEYGELWSELTTAMTKRRRKRKLLDDCVNLRASNRQRLPADPVA